MIYKQRMTASLDGDFVVFLIGMRINQPWKLHRWVPMTTAMSRMLAELYANPELGFMHHEMWLSRTIMIVQYWRSMAQLMDYAKSRDNAHLPAWQDFNRKVGLDGSVGIWHETYAASPGSYENIYANMPAFGLGKAGHLEPVRGRRESAAGRLRVTQTA